MGSLGTLSGPNTYRDLLHRDEMLSLATTLLAGFARGEVTYQILLHHLAFYLSEADYLQFLMFVFKVKRKLQQES